MKLVEMLTEDLVLLNQEVENWEEALRKSGELLVKSNKVESSYVDAMVDSVHKFGPYIVVIPSVALGHASPGPYVKEKCISMITLKDGISFGSPNDPVKVIFTFGTPEAGEHLEILGGIAKLFSNKKILEAILAAKNYDELIRLFT